LPVLAFGALDATGTFDLLDVNLINTTLAVLGTVYDPSGLLALSGSNFGRPPFHDHCDPSMPPATGSCLSGAPLVVASTAFLRQLAAAMHEDTDAVLAQGVVLLHVTEADGVTGVSGAKIRHVYGTGTNQSTPELTDGVYYLNADLTDSVHVISADDPSAVTSSNGLIVRLNAGNAQLYTATVNGAGTAFEVHLNGSRPGSVLETFFRVCGDPSLHQEGCPAN
jgi:hypothetical protein